MRPSGNVLGNGRAADPGAATVAAVGDPVTAPMVPNPAVPAPPCRQGRELVVRDTEEGSWP
jgi:hypothetical protein